MKVSISHEDEHTEGGLDGGFLSRGVFITTPFDKFRLNVQFNSYYRGDVLHKTMQLNVVRL